MSMKSRIAKLRRKRRTFGRLTVIDFDAGRGKYGHHLWRCRCDCGEVVEVHRSRVLTGHTQSCRCFREDRVREASTTHGFGGTPEYYVWWGMRTRCNNSQYAGWANYGGRGIKVCKRWHKFENFIADMGPRPDAKEGEIVTIERRNNNKGYNPENCHWETDPKKQQRNKRNNRLVTFKGKTQCVVAWAEELGICVPTLFWRLDNWTVARALTQPVQKRKSA